MEKKISRTLRYLAGFCLPFITSNLPETEKAHRIIKDHLPNNHLKKVSLLITAMPVVIRLVESVQIYMILKITLFLRPHTSIDHIVPKITDFHRPHCSKFLLFTSSVNKQPIVLIR